MGDRERLLRDTKSAYDKMPEGQWEEIEKYSAGYKAFLDAGKTERECAAEAVRQAEQCGFKPYIRGMRLSPGDKVYSEKFGKAVMLVTAGQKSLAHGLRIAATHIDSPRLDLKSYPLYEESGFALLKTHYYGGIKKYQWMTIPLELRGVVFLADGSRVYVSIGSGEDEPVLFISDVLPHLGADQAKKPVSEAFPGEGLNVTAGTLPHPEQGDGRVKLAVLALLERKYGMTETDFMSAELCLVPAGRARDAGLDGSLIGAYGHDDRSCAYAAFRAMLDTAAPEYTSVCIMADKEEIGSEGITGMQSEFFDAVLCDMCLGQGVDPSLCYENSFCLSADVCNALDPNFADVSDSMNNARIGFGPGVFKATGSRGKSGASDASAETVSRLRSLLDKNNIPWQMGELGKVDKGGGGTVAKYIANRGIEVIDIGVPVISMHSPFEVVSKIDCYLTYRACAALYEG